MAFTSNSNDRRLGRRWPSTGLVVGWDLHRLGRRGQRFVARDGIVLDVSVSGAAIIAPVDITMVEGRVVALAHGSHVGNVMIRRVMETDRADQVIYGVEFLDAPVRLVEALIERAAGGPTEHPYEELWALNV